MLILQENQKGYKATEKTDVLTSYFLLFGGFRFAKTERILIYNIYIIYKY